MHDKKINKINYCSLIQCNFCLFLLQLDADGVAEKPLLLLKYYSLGFYNAT